MKIILIPKLLELQERHAETVRQKAALNKSDHSGEVISVFA